MHARGALREARGLPQRRATHVNAIGRKLGNFYDLLSKLLAAQQPKELFGHALDPIQHIFFELDLSRALPIGKPLQRFIPSVPPVECQKSMDAGPRDDEVTHEPFTKERLLAYVHVHSPHCTKRRESNYEDVIIQAIGLR